MQSPKRRTSGGRAKARDVSATARALVAGQSIEGAKMAGSDRLWFELPPVGAFEAILI